MPTELTLLLLKAGQGAISKISLCNQLEVIYKAIHQIYVDISNYHFESAKQCFRSAVNTGSHYESKILDTISHLRDSYNIMKGIEYKDRNLKFLGFNIGTTDIIQDWDRESYYSLLADTSGLIAYFYKHIDDEGNFDDWQKIALENFDTYLGWKYMYIGSVWEKSKPDCVEEYYEEGGGILEMAFTVKQKLIDQTIKVKFY